MRISVFVPSWQIDDGDLAAPVMGGLFRHVLLFDTDDGDPAKFHGCFGREITVAGVAVPMTKNQHLPPGPFPTEIRCLDFSLYWDAPEPASGPLTLTGVIHSDDYGAAPDGFPEVQGTVLAVAEVSLLYVSEESDVRSWIPAPGRQQAFRPVDRYPGWIPSGDSLLSPQVKVTGLAVDIDTAATPPAEGFPGVAASSAKGKPAIRLRLFPDNAGTVLWLFGPVYYVSSRLSSSLTSEMKVWEAAYCASLTPGGAWKSPEVAADFTTTGIRLARRLSVELGKGFEVEFQSYQEGTASNIFRSVSRAGNAKAAKALRALVASERTKQAKLAALDNAPGTRWFAYAPLSGTKFGAPSSRS